MRRVGLIGGTSWVSSAHYYRALNEGVAAAIGGSASAPVTLWSVEFGEVARLQHDGDWAGVSRVLCDAARALAAAGCEGVALAANTTHLVADDVRVALGSTPLLDLVDLTATALAGRRRVGLLGTRFTMSSAMFPERLARDGIDVLVPDEHAQARVHDVIYDELTRDVVTEQARDDYLAVIDKLVADGAEAIVLACTELAMLDLDERSPVPLVDTTDVHCRALLDFILAGDPA
ncbi:aspartate racemase [Jatrophihabitans endophyticus]|uniref:Aspartate racemase n=1 Tax=Jatrophihabitans endophyticus TaxID=1206085 RepID=A0A1M5DA07_9ACTN|nr:amino acid racemase [Jatrophihabitans endophyticus]SHF63695.1 aspartate racemase [Jatrophihabitans endophyticus]